MDKALAGQPNVEFPEVGTKVLHGEKVAVPRG